MLKKKDLKKLGLLFSYLSLTMGDKVHAENSFQIWGNPKYATEIMDCFNQLPENVKDYFSDLGCNMVLIESNSGADAAYQSYGYPLPGSILGFATAEYGLPYNYSVYVECSDHDGYYERYPESSDGLTSDEFNYKITSSTLLHELGHVFDWNSIYSNTDEFINAFYADYEAFTNTQEYKVNNYGIFANISTSSEYFATAFACYFNYPDELSTYCPTTYNYFSNCFNNLYTNTKSDQLSSY